MKRTEKEGFVEEFRERERHVEDVLAAARTVAEEKLEAADREHRVRLAKAELEGGLTDVREELEKRDAERAEYVAGLRAESLSVYERVRQKHKDALAVVDGTIDRAASRIGTDLHCSACYMTITANDAVQVLEGKKLIRCKSCARILYVP